MNTMGRLMIISGTTHEKLSEEIVDKISETYPELVVGNRVIKPFSNSEIEVEILDTVAGACVFIIQSSLTGKVNDNFVESLLLIDAVKRARASRVFLVQLIFPYQRQDRREKNKNNRSKRRPISAKVIADCFAKAVNVTGVIMLKLHADQIEGFFDNNCIVEDIDPSKLFVEFLKNEGIINGKQNNKQKPPAIVAPDVGAAKATGNFAFSIGLDYIIVNKKREEVGKSEVTHIIGDYHNRDCIFYDDMIDTGGTVLNALKKLKEAKRGGSKRVYLMATHGVFSKNAIEKLGNSDFEKIVITDSIPNPGIEKYPDKFHVIKLAPFLSKVILNVFDQKSNQITVQNES